MDELVFRVAVLLPVLALAYRALVSEPVRATLRRAAARHATRVLRGRDSTPSLVRQFREAGLTASTQVEQDPVPAFCVGAGPVAGSQVVLAGSRVVVRRAGRRGAWVGTVERGGGLPAPVSAPPTPAAFPPRPSDPTAAHGHHPVRRGRAVETAAASGPPSVAVSARGSA